MKKNERVTTQIPQALKIFKKYDPIRSYVFHLFRMQYKIWRVESVNGKLLFSFWFRGFRLPLWYFSIFYDRSNFFKVILSITEIFIYQPLWTCYGTAKRLLKGWTIHAHAGKLRLLDDARQRLLLFIFIVISYILIFFFDFIFYFVF